MYISINTSIFAREYKDFEGLKKIIFLLKQGGFTAYDCSFSEYMIKDDDYLDKMKEIRDYADSIGIVCNQTHSIVPRWAKDTRWSRENYEHNVSFKEEVARCIKATAILGAKICVMHPCNYFGPEDNALMYKKYEQIARESGVKIALENMWDCINWDTCKFIATMSACSHHDDFLAHLKLLPSDVFCACVDIGHAEMNGLGTNAVQMIEALGDYVQAIHLHDIDGRYDNHSLPYTLSVDFDAVAKALKNIGYKGDVTLEISAPFSKFPKELYPTAARCMADVTNYFKNKIEK